MERVVADGFGRDRQLDEDLIALNRRVEAGLRRREHAQTLRAGMRVLLRRALMFYCLVCGLVIATGLDAVFPGPGRHLVRVFADPALELTGPFATCAQAHANGFYSIPRTSPGYVAEQDDDGDGRACDPSLHDLPNPMWRLRTVQDRLMEPW